MTNRVAAISQRKAGRVAGFGILIASIAAPFAFNILSMLIVPRDAATTANNIRANQWLFRIVIVSILITIMWDVVAALALYLLLKPVNESLSLLIAVFRLIYAIIFAISLAFLIIDPLSFNSVFLIGQVFFALHLVVLGYLVYKSGYIPRILGVLLVIGGSLGYLIESVAYFYFPDYVWIAYPGLAAGTIAEVGLALWLLVKGAKIPENPEIDS